MINTKKHIERSITSKIDIYGSSEKIWDNITNVKIEQFSDPFIFKLLSIPKPLRAEVLSEGEGGSRVAYFENGKKFIQKILVWKPMKHYSFSFNPEKGFKVLYFFELSDGIFRIPTGAYSLSAKDKCVSLELVTNYSIDKRLFFVCNFPARLILNIFQRYLLTSIKKNSE